MADQFHSGVSLHEDSSSSSSSSSCRSSSSPSSSPPWESLPSDLLDRALALLPLPDVFRLRLVCKRWSNLIHCAQFQKISSISSSWGPFFSPRVGWKRRGCPVVPWSCYDHENRKWTRFPELRFPCWARRECGWSLVAADGGLLCFWPSDGTGGILVCNPMTNRWKELPATGRGRVRAPVISHMIVEQQKSSYKILVAGNAANNPPDVRFPTNQIEIYDSLSSTWTSSEPFSSELLFRGGAYCGGAFYVLIRHYATGVHAVVTLDLATLTWRNNNPQQEHPRTQPLQIKTPETLFYPFVVACAGHVYLVGGNSEATDRTPVAGIALYVLHPGVSGDDTDGRGRWVKVSEYLNLPFLRSTGAIYGCGAWGSKIYVVTYAYDMWVAVFDCEGGVWEGPIKGNFFDMKDIFETKFRMQPNLWVAP